MSGISHKLWFQVLTTTSKIVYEEVSKDLLKMKSSHSTIHMPCLVDMDVGLGVGMTYFNCIVHFVLSNLWWTLRSYPCPGNIKFEPKNRWWLLPLICLSFQELMEEVYFQHFVLRFGAHTGKMWNCKCHLKLLHIVDYISRIDTSTFLCSLNISISNVLKEPSLPFLSTHVHFSDYYTSYRIPNLV